MPVTCRRCARELVAGSLRCQFCGADARVAPAIPGMLSIRDAMGHESFEDFVTRICGAAFVRRNKIVDRVWEISPEYGAWARLPVETRGPPPPIPPEHQAEIDALDEEYMSLLAKKKAREGL